MTSKTNSFLNRVINTAAWGDDTDSDDEPTPVHTPFRPVPTPVPTKCPWAKLEQKPEKPEKSEKSEKPEQKSEKPEKPEQKSEKPEKSEKPDGIRTLMIKNLPRDTSPTMLSNELRTIFKAYGPIKDIYIPINKDGKYVGTIKGFAKVQFHKSAHADNAYQARLTLRKNTLAIEYAREDR